MAVTFVTARAILERAVAGRVFPAAVVEVGTATEVLWREPFGTLTYDPDASPTREDAIFDLASLTKVLATTPLVMLQVERGLLGLDDRIEDLIACWRGADREIVTVRDLLAHCGGLGGHRPFFLDLRGREQFEPAICAEPLEYAPRTRSVYSDLGFMLLGFVLEREASLPDRFAALLNQMGPIQDLQFHPPALWLQRTAPTGNDPWRGRLLVGEVHDDNTWALGGAAGQAGLFGTAGAVGECARHLLQILDGRTGVVRRDTLETFTTRRADIPGSSRALGWDTMLPTSSCGTRISPRAFGHTGFTGTSLWIDPDRRVYVVLLTNRVHPTRDNDGIKHVRPAVHDAIIDALDQDRR
jgi:CubicO group peptidase (beta-lactamase class C family)